MNGEDIRALTIDFLAEVIRYYKSVNRNINVYQSMFGSDKRLKSANTRIEKKFIRFADELNVEFWDFAGSAYSAELPVEALNLDDFTENDNLVIFDTIEPTIKEKNSSNILKIGKVIVKKA